MTLSHRISQLERRTVRQGAEPQIIHIRGGLPGDEPMRANAGDLQLAREAGETVADFQARAVAAGRANRASFVVIGGLPE